MASLARFQLIVPLSSRAHFKFNPYHTYNLLDHYPENLFYQRIKEIEIMTRNFYPTTLTDYLTFWVAVMTSFITGFIAIGSSPRYFVILCFLGPICVWVWAIWWKHKTPLQVNKFEANMQALLETFSSSDIPTYSISWLFSTTAELDDETPSPTGALILRYVHIIFHDTESVPEDPLPLYLPQNENETPPDYGLPKYELKSVKVDESVDLGEATQSLVAGLNAKDVQRVLTHAPGRAGPIERDITDAGREGEPVSK